MSHAHLRALPDPKPGPDEMPSLGEGPLPAATTTNADEQPDAGELALPDGPPPGHRNDDLDVEPRGRGIMTVPSDLRQYYDVRQLAAYKPLIVEAGRRGGPFLLRTLRTLAKGVRVLGSSVYAWTGGTVGRGPSSVGARILCVVLGIYGVAHLTNVHPASPWAVAALAVLVVTLAGLGRLPLPGAATARKSTRARPKERKKLAPARRANTPFTGALARFGNRRGSNRTPPVAADTAPEAPPEAAGEKGYEHRYDERGEHGERDGEEPHREPPGKADETPVEAPPAPHPMTLLEALNHPRRRGRGVLLTALRDDLQLPHTRQVKQALDEAGIRWRAGVRTAAGSGPGVHASDVPPLPSPQGLPQSPTRDALVQVSAPTANANNAANTTANSPGEELRAEIMDLDSVTIRPNPSRYFPVECPPRSNESTGS
ncbi:hypothetical protein [Embleya sp. AB8]|uniref:hypothetical protein n=1 Tax=Embleya sp. AB8 TaxID=3156304 RepID=UPI003C7336A5